MRLRERLESTGAKLIVTVVGLGLMGGVAFAASYSPLFAAKSIAVEGAVHLSTSQVLAAAGVSNGTNVLHLDTEAVAAAIETDPWVADASIRTDPPSTIAITITERRPLALVGPEHEAVAPDGVVLPAARPGGLPEIQSLAGPLSSRGRRSALEVLALMPRGLWRRVSVTTATNDGWISLQLRDGPRVVYGTTDDGEAKIEALRSLLSWAEREGKELVKVDVRVPTAPAATLAGDVALPT